MRRTVLASSHPSTRALFLFGASGAVPVFGYRPLVDGAQRRVAARRRILHILFNMMALRQLAPATADLYGAGRTVIIYTAAASRASP